MEVARVRALRTVDPSVGADDLRGLSQNGSALLRSGRRRSWEQASVNLREVRSLRLPESGVLHVLLVERGHILVPEARDRHIEHVLSEDSLGVDPTSRTGPRSAQERKAHVVGHSHGRGTLPFSSRYRLPELGVGLSDLLTKTQDLLACTDPNW